MSKLNKNEIAEAFQVTRNCVSGWVLAGCPIAQRGRPGQLALFDLSRVIDWRNRRRLDSIAFWEETQHVKEQLAEEAKSVRKRARALVRRTKQDAA